MEALLQFRSKLRIREFSEGYTLYKTLTRRGASKVRWIKAVFFSVLGIGMIVMLAGVRFHFEQLPVCTVVLLICMQMGTYYFVLVPRQEKLRGEHLYKSSRLLSKECEMTWYPDHFTVINAFEKLNRSYREITDCLESEQIILLSGGEGKKAVMIAKKCLSPEQYDCLVGILKEKCGRQYRVLPGRRKVHGS